MLEMLALGALSGGMNLLSGLGKQQASAKQARLQMMADENARQENARQLAIVNEARERLGRELLTIPETTSQQSYSSQSSRGGSSSSTRGGSAQDNYSYVDVDSMMAAAKRSGFNPVTWLNAGGMQAYTQTGSRMSNWSDTETAEWSDVESFDGQTVTRTGHNAADAFKLMVPEYTLTSASQIPQQHSMLETLGGAGTAALSTFTDLYKNNQNIQAKERAFGNAMGKILAGAGASYGGGGLGGGGSSGSVITNGGNASVARGLSATKKPSDNDDWSPQDLAAALESQPLAAIVEKKSEIKFPELTQTNSTFPVITTNPDAQQYADRSGDSAEEVMGWSNIVDGAQRMFTGRSFRQMGKEHGNNIGDYPGNTLQQKFINWYNDPKTNMTLSGFGGSVKPYEPFAGAR